LVLARRLSGLGFKKVITPADLVIINTCSVTKIALAKDRSIINKARLENPSAKIVVMGCYPKVYKPEIAGVDLIWGTRNFTNLISKIKLMFPETKNWETDLGCSDFKKEATDKARYFLKIQDGCRQFCSYCVIPYARGRLRSRKSAAVLVEIKRAVKAGYQEIILSGIHLGLYGVDLAEKINLVELLKKILKDKSNFRIRLSSIEITEVTPELIALMVKEPRLCRHLHISLQSGNDKILKAMNRPYTTAQYAKVIKDLRKKMPEIAISTDVIVGFPGEAESDFQKTYDFAKKINFSKIHVFSFSPHEKTPAFNFPNRVTAPDIKDRSRRLRELSEKQELAYKQKILKKYQKTSLAVLIERQKNGIYYGKTEFYFELAFTKTAILESVVPSGLIGRLVRIAPSFFA
jgi:threonylcarbamoyladenosine tRNA methylthiotransferase MtaB